MAIYMAMGLSVSKQLSIAAARDGFTRVVREVERGEPVELTRRGKTVAVLIPVQTWLRLTGARPSFAAAVEAWREAHAPETDEEVFEGLRDRSPGRPVDL